MVRQRPVVTGGNKNHCEVPCSGPEPFNIGVRDDDKLKVKYWGLTQVVRQRPVVTGGNKNHYEVPCSGSEPFNIGVRDDIKLELNTGDWPSGKAAARCHWWQQKSL